MKRRLLIIAVFLLAGAVVNVAVAWGWALWGPLPAWVEPTTPAGMWPRPVPDDWPRVVGGIQSNFGLTRIWTFSHLGLGRELPPEYFTLRRDRFGFPSRCLEAEIQGAPRGAEILVGLRAPLSWRPRWQAAVLPLRPIWPGFAINTIFYAALLWLLTVGPFTLRRFLRLRRGLCPRCAYPMGESAVCTECGMALRSRTRSNHRQHDVCRC